jgi:hypothetical protein
MSIREVAHYVDAPDRHHRTLESREAVERGASTMNFSAGSVRSFCHAFATVIDAV